MPLPVRIHLLLIMLCCCGCYTINSAVEFSSLYLSRNDLQSVLRDSKTPENIRHKLLQTKELMAFAEENGLHSRGAYESFIQLDRPVVSYIFSASPPFEFKSETWWFPFVGSVPYLGYFEKSERDKKAYEYEKLGFDVYLGGAAAFSSLGWFEDPLFSSMLKRPNYAFANLILHELVHRTIWVSGFPKFNENLATFLADVLTREYLVQKKQENALRLYESRKRDRRLFQMWVISLKGELKRLYANPTLMPLSALHAEKERIIKTYSSEKKPKFEVVDFVEGSKWNNATIMASSLYQPDLELFKRAYECYTGRTKGFIEDLRLRIDKARDPFLALKKLCLKEGS